MEPTTHEHPRRRRRFGALLLMAALTASLGAGAISLAIFTDSQAVTGNALSAGEIDISVTPATPVFTAVDMMPGDVAEGELLVTNGGASALRYAMSTTVVSGALLAGQLELTVKTVGTSCADFDGDVVVATTALSGAGFGSSAQGPDTGTVSSPAASSRLSASRRSSRRRPGTRSRTPRPA